MLKGIGNILGKISDFAGMFKEGGDYANLGGPLAFGLPAIFKYFGAKADARRIEEQNARMLAEKKIVQNYYNDPSAGLPSELTPPPLTDLVQNLNFTGNFDASGQPMYESFTAEDFPVRSKDGGIMKLAMGGQPEVSYSAYGNDGIKGGFYSNIKEAEDDVNKVPPLTAYMNQGGDTMNFPRRTGTIRGPGTKTSDSIPAMLSDGEFVQRTDAVNGAGIMMGAKNANEAQKKGAQFMYALQDRLAKMGKQV